MKESQNILICPLEWGLGHAGRMIPLAARLREMKYTVNIGAGDELLSFFRKELPGLRYIRFPGFNPKYSALLPPYISVFLKIPALVVNIFLEHFRLNRLITDNSIDIVISDNRFGLWNRRIKTVYITHMLRIPFPRPLRFLEFIGIILHKAIISKYSLCFIPDLPDELNISGRLSHDLKLPANIRYIGLLSRFTGICPSSQKKPVNNLHITVILSGPEPQRSLLKKKLEILLQTSEYPVVILGCRPDKSSEPVRSGNVIYYDHLPATEMKNVIIGSRGIIARSGYTTIMELISLGCNALLVPTPGQTEQEYLARHLARKGWFFYSSQKLLNKGIDCQADKPAFPDEIMVRSKMLLEKALKELSKEDEYQGCAC